MTRNEWLVAYLEGADRIIRSLPWYPDFLEDLYCSGCGAPMYLCETEGHCGGDESEFPKTPIYPSTLEDTVVALEKTLQNRHDTEENFYDIIGNFIESLPRKHLRELLSTIPNTATSEPHNFWIDGYLRDYLELILRDSLEKYSLGADDAEGS